MALGNGLRTLRRKEKVKRKKIKVSISGEKGLGVFTAESQS